MTDRIAAIHSAHHIDVDTTLHFRARRIIGNWWWSPGVGLIRGETALQGAWEALADQTEKENTRA